MSVPTRFTTLHRNHVNIAALPHHGPIYLSHFHLSHHQLLNQTSHGRDTLDS